MYIETTIQKTPTEQEVWGYYVRDDVNIFKLELDIYRKQTRVTSRHKWVSEKRYIRLSKRDSNMLKQEVYIPTIVEEKIKADLISRIEFI